MRCCQSRDGAALKGRSQIPCQKARKALGKSRATTTTKCSVPIPRVSHILGLDFFKISLYNVDMNNNNNKKGESKMKVKKIRIHDVECIVSNKSGKIIYTIGIDGKPRQDPLAVRTFQNLKDMSDTCGYPGYEVIKSS